MEEEHEFCGCKKKKIDIANNENDRNYARVNYTRSYIRKSSFFFFFFRVFKEISADEMFGCLKEKKTNTKKKNTQMSRIKRNICFSNFRNWSH